MRRLLPKTIAGQLIALLLVGLIAAQAVTTLVFVDERRVALRTAAREQVLARTASVVRLLEQTPPEIHRRVLVAASNPRLRFSVDQRSAVEDGGGRPVERLAGVLGGMIGDDRAVRILVQGDDRGSAFRGQAPRPGERRRLPPLGLLISVPLADGSWLNADVWPPPRDPEWALAPLASMLLMAVAIFAVVALTVRRITKPLAALAAAADRAGRGEDEPPLPESGPEEVRRTTRAFNAMRARLHRFVADRTRMLAAISHDLRTPITSLRLRAEFIDDAETREKVLETLDEMSRMTEAALTFAGEEAAAEETRPVDLAALLESLTDDLAELGLAVSFAGPERLVFRCRPLALKRAVRNLVENGVRYGDRARVALEAAAGGVTITVDDDGPGIPRDRLDDVFEPFVRLEGSRSRDTGGVGLGLAIARSIVRGHGGELTLANRSGGGLRATITLPMPAG